MAYNITTPSSKLQIFQGQNLLLLLQFPAELPKITILVPQKKFSRPSNWLGKWNFPSFSSQLGLLYCTKIFRSPEQILVVLS